MKKILSRKNVLVALFALCLTFASAFAFNVKTAKADGILTAPDADTTAKIAQAINDQPDIDTISLADIGMGYIGEAEEFTTIDRSGEIKFNSNNVLQSLIFKFYYSPASDLKNVTVRVGFSGNWNTKARFMLNADGESNNYSNISILSGSGAYLADTGNVFTDANKEYLVELKVIRVKDSNTLLSASVDGVEKLNAEVPDVGEYATSGDNTTVLNKIHFYKGAYQADLGKKDMPFTIRDFREIDTNYDVITTHDVEHWHPTEEDKTVKYEELTLERKKNDNDEWEGVAYHGWWAPTNDDANVVYRFYYNTGDKANTEEPFTIRMKPTQQHVWVGIKVALNVWGGNYALDVVKENSDDSGEAYATNVFTETNKDYLIEIGTVGIKDSEDKGYFYIKVDGVTKVAMTYSSDVYTGPYLSYYSSKEVNRTISSIETVKVYNENGEKIDEYEVKCGSSVTAPDYTPGATKDGDKYYENYEYKYWSANGKDEFNFETDKVQSDMELKPYYLGANAKEYEITFKGNGSEQKVKYSIEKELVEPTVPAKEYYTGAWADYEPKYENNQVVEAVYTAIEYKVTVKFAYDDTKEDVEFKFSADNTAEEIAAILKQIQELNTDKNSYTWDVEPTELQLGANVEYTLNKVEPADGGCFGSITSNSWLFAALALSAAAFAICSAKKQKNN